MPFLFAIFISLIAEFPPKPSVKQLTFLYEQRISKGSQAIDNNLLEQHYAYWLHQSYHPTAPVDSSGLFLFLATCHLEKKYEWSSKIINAPANRTVNFYEQDAWKKEVIDYFHHVNQAAVSRQNNIPYLINKVRKLQQFPTHNPEWLALAMDRLGRSYYDKNVYDSAAFFLEQAGKLMVENQWNLYLANNLTMRGVVWDAKEQFDKSAQLYEESLRVLESLEHPPLGTLGANAYNVGLIYEDRFGNGLKGLPYYQKALEYDLKAGSKAWGIVSEDYAAIARCYLREGDILKAEKYALLSVDIAQQLQPSKGFEYARALLVVSEVMGFKNQMDLGLTRAKEALLIFETIEKNFNRDLRRQKIMVFNLLGKLYLKSERFAEAQGYFLKAVDLSQQISREVYLLEAYPGLIEAAIQESNWKDATVYWKQWGQIIQDKFQEAIYHQQLHRLKGLEIAVKMNQQPADGLLLEVELQDFFNEPNLNSDLLLKGLHLKTVFLRNKNTQGKAVWEHLAELQRSLYEYLNFQHHVVNAAFQRPELKSFIKEALLLGLNQKSTNLNADGKLTLFNLISFNKSLGSIPKRNLQIAYHTGQQALVERENKVSERYAEVSFMIYAHEIGQKKLSKEQVQKLTLEESKLEVELGILRDQLKSKAASYFYSFFVSPLNSLKELERTIKKDELWIETFVHQETIIAMFATQDDLSFRILPLEKSMSFQTQTTGGGSLPTSSPSWENVFEVDLKKFERLIYVPDEWLAFLPLEVFTFRDRLLIFSKSISYDVSLIDRIRRVPVSVAPSKTFWTGFAPFYKDRELIYAAEEVQRIHQMTQGKSFIGASVTKDVFKHEASQSQVFHLAAHGHSELLNPGYNALVFGDELDEYLTVNEIYDWSIHANMGVLSACGSGIVNTQQGGGILSLGRAFHFAGVPTLVISLWEIPDKQSAVIMEYFYQNILKGLSKSESLRLAKVRYLEQTEDDYLKHPYYWAGLVLLGEDQPNSTSSYAWWMLWIGLGIVGLFLWKFLQKRAGIV